MFDAFGKIAADKKGAAPWDEHDTRYFVQDYLRAALRSDAVFCDSVSQGKGYVRVATPLLQQEVLLRQYDLMRTAEKEERGVVNSLVVRVEI